MRFPAPTTTHGGITCDSQHTIVNLLHVIAYPCLVMHFALHSGHSPDHAAAVNPKGQTNTTKILEVHVALADATHAVGARLGVVAVPLVREMPSVYIKCSDCCRGL